MSETGQKQLPVRWILRVDRSTLENAVFECPFCGKSLPVEWSVEDLPVTCPNCLNGMVEA